MTLHKAWLAISALAGLPLAGLGLLLLVPAALDRSPAVFLLMAPSLLVVWAIALLVRVIRSRCVESALRRRLLAFYAVSGGIAVWAATWDFSRDGAQAPLFSPLTRVAVALFFVVPFLHLLFSPVAARPDTEPGASPMAAPPRRLAIWESRRGRHR